MFGDDWEFLEDNENMSEIEPMVQDMMLEYHVSSRDETFVSPNRIGVGLDGSHLNQNKESQDLVDSLFHNMVEFPGSGSGPNKAQEDPEEPDINIDDILLDFPIEDQEGVQEDEVNLNKVEVQIEVEDFVQFEEDNQPDGLGKNKSEVESNMPNPDEAELKLGKPNKHKVEVETNGSFEVEVGSDSEKTISDEAFYKPNNVSSPNNVEVQSSGPTRLECEVEQGGSNKNEIKSHVDGPVPHVTKSQVNEPTLTKKEINVDLHAIEKATTQAHPLATKEFATQAIVPGKEEVAAEAILLMSNDAQVYRDGPQRHLKRKSIKISVQQDEPKRRGPRQVDLPLGWAMKPKKRMNNGKTNGVTDKIYISPSGNKFRSWKKAKEYIDKQNQEVKNEEQTFVVNPEVPDATENVGEVDS